MWDDRDTFDMDDERPSLSLYDPERAEVLAIVAPPPSSSGSLLAAEPDDDDDREDSSPRSTVYSTASSSESASGHTARSSMWSLESSSTARTTWSLSKKGKSRQNSDGEAVVGSPTSSVGTRSSLPLSLEGDKQERRKSLFANWTLNRSKSSGWLRPGRSFSEDMPILPSLPPRAASPSQILPIAATFARGPDAIFDFPPPPPTPTLVSGMGITANGRPAISVTPPGTPTLDAPPTPTASSSSAFALGPRAQITSHAPSSSSSDADSPVLERSSFSFSSPTELRPPTPSLEMDPPASPSSRRSSFAFALPPGSPPMLSGGVLPPTLEVSGMPALPARSMPAPVRASPATCVPVALPTGPTRRSSSGRGRTRLSPLSTEFGSPPPASPASAPPVPLPALAPAPLLKPVAAPSPAPAPAGPTMTISVQPPSPPASPKRHTVALTESFEPRTPPSSTPRRASTGPLSPTSGGLTPRAAWERPRPTRAGTAPVPRQQQQRRAEVVGQTRAGPVPGRSDTSPATAAMAAFSLPERRQASPAAVLIAPEGPQKSVTTDEQPRRRGSDSYTVGDLPPPLPPKPDVAVRTSGWIAVGASSSSSSSAAAAAASPAKEVARRRSWFGASQRAVGVSARA